MMEINEDPSGFILHNPFRGIQISLNNTPEIFIGIITAGAVIPDSSIEPERKLELAGLLVALGHSGKISWEIPDWEFPNWFLTYIES